MCILFISFLRVHVTVSLENRFETVIYAISRYFGIYRKQLHPEHSKLMLSVLRLLEQKRMLLL